MNKISSQNLSIKNKIAIIGLGYVGLPLAIEFGKIRDVIGFDIKKSRIDELKNHIDTNFDIQIEQFKKSKKLNFTNNVKDIRDCSIFIVTAPTPVNNKNRPDLRILKKACEMIGSILKRGSLVIFESTVYPGVTEEICAPIIEKKSGMIFNKDFFCGYSPERINPGDKVYNISSIIKVTAGSTPEIAKKVDKLYKEIIKAGTYKASNIKVAEAAKVIENTQRDVNIALINELAIIFNQLNIDTESVLKAAGTKWNFLNFRPGLVGGHCIGVDPYYLAHKALKEGYNPQMILSGRRLNNKMGSYVAKQTVKLMRNKSINIKGSNILIMGLTFKENCPDIRNTKVLDLILEFKKFKSSVDIYDPWADKEEAMSEYKIELIDYPHYRKYDAILLAVAHKKFKKMSISKIRSFGKKKSIIYDAKYLFKALHTDGRL
jgi:UDP-N-acetyl-D-glucosamine/UDP-N-acetyl-D-galactosamine dehydrogenase